MAGANVTGRPETGRELLFDRSARTVWRLSVDRAAQFLLPLLFLVAVIPILDLVYWVSVQALPTLSLATVLNTNPRDPYALGVPVFTTIEVMLWATGLSVALGLFGGIATAEFLSERWAGWVRMSANLLVGTPSVVVGYFGYFAFVLAFGWGLSFIAGATTLAFFMTPYIFRVTDLAYSSIPRPIREAALGSGARPYQYVAKVAAPIAFPQILNGVFLAMAIGVGETAPLVLTSTNSVLIPPSLFSPATFLTATIWRNFDDGTGPGLVLAFQAAFIVLMVVVALNIAVRVISARYQKRLEGLYQ
jgi:phosphate transport system permease protein